MIKFQCEHCGRQISAADEDVATTTQCPGCHRILLVPAASKPAPSASPPPPSTTYRTKASPDVVVGESIAGDVRGIVAALALIATIALGVFSIWAEWGPYAWIVAVQMAIAHAYSPKATMALTFVFFVIPSVLLYFMMKGRMAKWVFGGVMGTAGALLFAATAYYMGTGDASLHSTSISEAAASATFLPHSLTVPASSLSDLPAAPAYGIKKSGNSTITVYTQIQFPEDPARPSLVYLATEKGSLEYHLIYEKDLAGTIRYRPLPYLVRRAAPPGTPLFALVFSKDESVRSVWLPSAFTLATVGFFFMQSRRQTKRVAGPRRLP